MNIENENKCFYCNKKLNPFTTHFDWKSRKYHKTCYKKKTLDFCYELMLDEMRETVSSQ